MYKWAIQCKGGSNIGGGFCRARARWDQVGVNDTPTMPDESQHALQLPTQRRRKGLKRVRPRPDSFGRFAPFAPIS